MDVMIDIETLANTSNSVISQVAAIVFDRYTGNIIDGFKRNVDLQTCVDIGLEMNVDTIEWWLEQDKEAQKSILKKPRQSIKGVLTDLSVFIKKNWAILHNDKETFKNGNGSYTTIDGLFDPLDVKLWCHATFDEPILSNAYNKAGIVEPWHFRGVRDCKFQIKYTVECIKQLTK